MNIFNTGLIDKLANEYQLFPEKWQYTLAIVGSVLIAIIVSYLLGSINSAIVVSKMLYGEDVRTHGSGNAGLTNMLRTYGAKAAALTLVGDMLKTILAVLFTALLFGFSYKNSISLSGYCYLAGLAAVLGHVFPIFYGFKGGKGVLVTASMALLLCPLHFAVLIVIFIIIVAITGYVSLGSIVVASLFPITVCLYIPLVCSAPLSVLTVISTFFLGAFIVWCHRSNIKRLAEGSEKKISIGKKEKKD